MFVINLPLLESQIFTMKSRSETLETMLFSFDMSHVVTKYSCVLLHFFNCTFSMNLWFNRNKVFLNYQQFACFHVPAFHMSIPTASYESFKLKKRTYCIKYKSNKWIKYRITWCCPLWLEHTGFEFRANWQTYATVCLCWSPIGELCDHLKL